ncbi:MAG: M23 family metallopeptidase [Muribaculaceae bacterium]|nr:M23 family metallopeptidase [Muribaculaceae bacterium]
MKMRLGFVFICMMSGTVYAASLLQTTNFPKTVDNVKLSDRMDLLAEDYNNYAGLSPYQQLRLDEAEYQAHQEIDNTNAAECAATGNACDIDTPISDGSTYNVATNDNSNNNTSGNDAAVAESHTVPETVEYAVSSVKSPQVATGYCSVRQPEIPQGQKVPLGSPVRFEDLPTSASDRSKRIAKDSKKRSFCSPYGCREKYNNRGIYRPHRGVDIGCTADYFGMPIYTPADGVVTMVGHAQKGKSAGNYIRIKHTDGWETQYMHLEQVFVSKGQSVSAGCAIGLLGHSGGNADSKNPSMGKDISHLHYEVIYNGSASNVETPNGSSISIVRGGSKACGDFKAKIKPDDFVTYYYK